jgi:hypothetical protein
MENQKKINPITYSNSYLDEILTKELDRDGRARLKAVELTVVFSMNQHPTIEHTDALINKFYNFITNKNE